MTTEELPTGTPVRYWPAFTAVSSVGRITSAVRMVGPERVQSVDTWPHPVPVDNITALPLEDGVIEVLTAAEALEVCEWDGITDVVVSDNGERIRLQRLMRGLI